MKKYFSILMALTLLITFFISYNIFLSANCKRHSFSKILNSISDFGIFHYKECYSKNNVLNNIKILLKNNEFLYQIARKFRRTYITSWFKYDNPFNEKNIEYVKNKKIEEVNLEKPFIEGLINETIENFDKNLIFNDDYEYTSWIRSHGGYRNTHYDSNNYINKNNIYNLKLEWIYKSIEKKDLKKKWLQNIQVNPILFDNKLIVVTADWKIVALNPINGKVIWEIQSIQEPTRRGIVAEYDEVLKKNFLYISIGRGIYKINIENGKRIKNFGLDGFINNFSKSAPIIYKNKLITGYSSINIFNKVTGENLDRIEFHPSRNFHGGLTWGGIALDEKKGIVYVATGNPKPGSYGVTRPGDNKNSNSILAIDINKKKIIWSFQETAHDLWDYDIPSPPIVFDLVVGNKVYETVIVVTKVGNTLILERNTGKPLYDINYKKAPNSKMTGDYTSKYQIFLKKPERFSKIEFSLNDISDLSENRKKEILKKMNNSIYGWYEPPSFGKDLFTFGVHGGAQWPGAAIDPINQNLFIPVNNEPWTIRPQILSREIITFFPKNLKKNHKEYLNLCSSCHGSRRNGVNKEYKEEWFNYIPGLVGFYKFPELKYKMSSLKSLKEIHPNLIINQSQFNGLQDLFKWWDIELDRKKEIKIEADASAWTQFKTKNGLPGSNPPWGYIAKLNLLSGKILWKSPVGYKNINGKEKKIGTVNFGGIALNSGGIIFFTGTEDGKAYAIDAETGEELWTYQMEAPGSAPPIIYNINNKQYVSFVSTGGKFKNYNKKMNKSSNIYTFSID